MRAFSRSSSRDQGSLLWRPSTIELGCGVNAESIAATEGDTGTVLDFGALAEEVHGSLKDLADPERRRATEGYFPTKLEILGVSAPKMRGVLREVHLRLRGESPDTVLQVVWRLRAMGTHEGRQVAFELVDKRPDARARLTPDDIDALGQGNDNWASVDGFSVMVSGPAWREGLLSDTHVLSWASSLDRWWRRTALVSTVALNVKSRGGTGDPPRTLLVCRELVSHHDPMVAKALSWALRSLVSVDRAAVQGFLRDHEGALAGLVVREVQNKLRTGRKTPRR